MMNFNKEIRRIAEENPIVAPQLRKAFPDVFPDQGRFIIHIGSGRKGDPSRINCMYFIGEAKEDTKSKHMVKLNGTWSSLTSDKYPDQHNILFTGILKVEDGVLVEVNETHKKEE